MIRGIIATGVLALVLALAGPCTAGTSAGGPFRVTAKRGAVQGVATVAVAPR